MHAELSPIPLDFLDELGSHGFLLPAKDTTVTSIPLGFTRFGAIDEWATLVQRVTPDVLSMSSIRHRQSSVEKAVEVVFANLALARTCDPQLWVRHGRDSKAFKGSGVSFRAALSVIDGIRDLGLVEYKLGVTHKDSGKSYRSIMRGTQKFQDLLDSFGVSGWSVRKQAKGPLLLRNKAGDRDLKFRPDKTTRRYEANLATINAIIQAHDIRMDLPLGIPFPCNYYRFKRRPYDVSRVLLYRVFNRGSFKCGGRFFGHWAQMIPSGYRKYIQFDGEPTVEIDYSSMHISMLYAMMKLPAPSSGFYELPGHDRGLCKVALNTLLNATSIKSAKQAIGYRVLQNDLSVRKGEIRAVVEKLMDKHKVVAPFFASDAGVHLMAVESAIAEDIMLAFAAKGRVCLPLHDSFLCQSKCTEELDAQMHESYGKVLAAQVKTEVKHKL